MDTATGAAATVRVPEPRVVTLYCVYDHPRDFPAFLVVRRFTITAWAETPAPIAALYHGFSAMLMDYGHLEWLPRAASDDPVILGCWV